MKQHFAKWLFVTAFFVGVASHAQAALITSHFSNLGGNNWTLDLALTNSDVATGINELTVYFSESLFTNLVVLNSPANWDSLVAQPDTVLNSPGFFDSYNAQALALGDSQNGFKIGFTLIGQQIPSVLNFDLLDNNFNLIASGVTQNARVDEPIGILLALIGTLALVVTRLKKRTMFFAI